MAELRNATSPSRLIIAGMFLAMVVSGCSSTQTATTGRTAAYTPRDIDDHIRDSAQRFDIPEEWIRAVMQVESGGRTHFSDGRPIISPAGAMGLMQVMPQTYAELRSQHGLGHDPYEPRDNIMAGAAYIRQMYDEFGSPGFLGAYNAGPRRYAQHVYEGRSLPAETRRYMAIIAPQIAGIEPNGRGSTRGAATYAQAPARSLAGALTAAANPGLLSAPTSRSPAVRPRRPVQGTATAAVSAPPARQPAPTVYASAAPSQPINRGVSADPSTYGGIVQSSAGAPSAPILPPSTTSMPRIPASPPPLATVSTMESLIVQSDRNVRPGPGQPSANTPIVLYQRDGHGSAGREGWINPDEPRS